MGSVFEVKVKAFSRYACDQAAGFLELDTECLKGRHV
jgi:hypothetical protein